MTKLYVYCNQKLSSIINNVPRATRIRIFFVYFYPIIYVCSTRITIHNTNNISLKWVPLSKFNDESQSSMKPLRMFNYFLIFRIYLPILKMKLTTSDKQFYFSCIIIACIIYYACSLLFFSLAVH